MTARTRVIATALVVALAGGGYLASRSSDGAATKSVPAAASFRFDFPRGTRLDYAVRIASTQHAAGPKATAGGPSTIDATVTLAGLLEVRSYGRAGDAWRLGLVFRRLDEQALAVLGNDGLAGVTLVGEEAIVELGDRGELRAIATRPGAPDAFKSLAHFAAQSLLVTAPPGVGAEWTADEATALGRARSTYRTSGDPFTWERSRTYATLAALGGAGAGAAEVTSNAKIRLAREGWVDDLDARDRVVLAAAHLDASVDVTMKLEAKGAFDPASGLASDADLERRSAGDPISAAAMRKKSIEQMAGTLAFSDVETRLRALSAGVPVEEGFMTKAVAFLMLHPEHHAALAKMCDEREANARSRAYVLDLLRSVGTPEAQAAMRAVLASPTVKADARAYPSLVERLALVTSPELETVRFAQATLDAATDPLTRRAALVALGSSAGARHRMAGDAKPFVDRLAAELEKAKTEQEKQAAVAAIGNAAPPDAAQKLQKHAKDASPVVRAEVATALRKVHTKEARDVLVELLSDREAPVARATLRSLEQHPLDRSEVARIADAVSAPGFSSAADDEVLTLAAKHGDAREDSGRMLRAVAARSDGSPKLRARAEMLLAAMPRR